MTHLPQPSTSSSLAILGRRLVAGLVVIALALLALKLVVGFVIGLVTTVLTIAAIVGLIIGGVWISRRL